MKFTIGLMACIAIAFVFITSPDKQQTQASIDDGRSNAQTQAIAELSRVVGELRYSIEQDRSDIEQKMNTKFVNLANELASQNNAVTAQPDSDELWTAVRELEAKQAELEKKVADLEAAKVAAKPAPTYPSVGGSGVKSGGSSGGVTMSAPVVVRSSVRSFSYSPRWNNYDGRSRRQHAVEVHGFDPSLSDAELAAQHDAYHDTYGGDPPTSVSNVLAPVRLAPAMRTRTTTVQSPMLSNCPGGVCPTSRSTTVQSAGGVLGFGILGRRR